MFSICYTIELARFTCEYFGQVIAHWPPDRVRANVILYQGAIRTIHFATNTISHV